MKVQQLINLVTLTKENRLLSRDLANTIFSSFHTNIPSKIEVDFMEIEFISRTFADQFHKNKIDLFEKKNVEIIVVNCNNQVFETFQEVAKTNHESFKRFYNKSVYNISTINTRHDLQKLNFSF